MMRDLIAVGVAYLLGCIQTGYYLVRAATGEDLRRLGSGSTGARNAGRVLGRWGFLGTLAGDAGKGALAVAAARGLGASPLAVAATVTAAAVGHVWPAQLRFSGGRGVAVGLGSLAVYDPMLLGILAAVTLAGLAITRRFQAAGLAGFAVLPIAAAALRRPPAAWAGAAGLGLVVLVAHRSHIARWLTPVPAGEAVPAADARG